MNDFWCNVFRCAVIRVNVRRACQMTGIGETQQLNTNGIVAIVDVDVVGLKREGCVRQVVNG